MDFSYSFFFASLLLIVLYLILVVRFAPDSDIPFWSWPGLAIFALMLKIWDSRISIAVVLIVYGFFIALALLAFRFNVCGMRGI